MKTHCLLSPLLACFFVAASQAEEFEHELYCETSLASFAATNSSEYRKYAPSREIDILHLALEVTPDFAHRTVAGKTTITFKPIAKPLEELSLDAVNLKVSALTSSETVLEWQVTEGEIVVTFSRPIPPDKETWVAVEHSAEPEQGLYFRTPEMGYREGESHLFTQGEAIEARHWYPCFDAPNEKFTSEITCRVPEGMTVLSNGKRISQERDPATGLLAVKWLQDKPHVNYLLSLVAGYFEKVEDKYRDIPLAFYTPPSDIREAANSFRGTKDMLAFFEQEIGVPYPWDKYYQVVVNDFVAGGMENTSLTTLTDRTLFTEATENIRSSQSLVAHELAHQWFGDLTTCKDWSQIWLNEGFATFYDLLYEEHKNGRDTMVYLLHRSAQGILEQTGPPRPIVDRKYDTPNDRFGYLAYDKGSWVLHMLRSQLGQDLYRRCIKTWVERHQFNNVVTEDLNAVVEELSGRSFDQFFDQWVYHAHHPELDVNYSWDARAKLAKVSIRQTQKLSDDVLLFNFPLTVRFKTKTAVVDRPITVKEVSEDFYFALSEAPTQVRIDPEQAVLARINFTPPNPLLHDQLTDETDPMGRILAVETLGKRKDKESVAKLKHALGKDAFYGVRLEAARALRAIHTDEALEALLASTNQPDARVRRQVYAGIGGFYHPKAYAAAQAMLAAEKNPDVQTTAIAELGAYPEPDAPDALLRYLNSTSYRNGLADAAVAGIRSRNDPSLAAPLLENLRARESNYTSPGFARALGTLGYLARDEEDKDAVREFLLSHASHKKRTVRIGAFNALGELQDPRALPVLEKFALARKINPEQAAANRAIKAINDARRPVEGIGDLRKELLDLQKTNRDLRENFNALEKKFEALSARPEATKKPARVVRSPKATK